MLGEACIDTPINDGVSGQAVQPVPLTSLKLSMAVYGQKLYFFSIFIFIYKIL